MVGKPEGRRALRRPRHRWDDNNKMNIQDMEWEDMDRIALALDRDK